MSTDELRACIDDSIKLMENYKSFGSMVEEGIKAFQRIGECLVEPTEEQKAEVKELLAKLNKEIGPYQGYVPSVANAIEKLTAWSETF